MDFEQIIKRVEWLDEEFRKEKISHSSLMDVITRIETDNKILEKKIKDISKDISAFSSMDSRLEQFNTAINNYRIELTKRIEESEKNSILIRKEAENRFRLEFDGISRSIDTLQKKTETSEINRKIEARIHEEQRLSQIINEIVTKQSQVITLNNDINNASIKHDEVHRQESKKLSEVISDYSSLKKRLEELRNRIEVIPDNLRRVETRVAEITTSELERRHSQTSFIEQQSLLQIERDNIQKELKEKIEKMNKQSQLLESQIQEWDAVQRNVKQAQVDFIDINQKYERRINEITEMQRLADDRFRQEWMTFKTDYQKRWTSFSLAHDEQFKETNDGIANLSEKISPLEDNLQAQQDIIQQTREANEEYLHGILVQIQELLAAYLRISGQTKK